MIKLTPKKLVVAIGGAAVMMTAGTGIASADPIVDTTCTYPQVVAALNAQDPVLGQKFAASPLLQSELQSFLAAPRDVRQAKVVKYQSSPTISKYFGPITAIAGTCNNF